MALTRRAWCLAMTAVAVVLALAGPVTAAEPSAPSPESPAARYVRGYGLLTSAPYAAVVRIGVTRHGATRRDDTTDVMAFDTSATQSGFSVSELRPWPFGDVPVSRVIGTGGRLYFQVEDEPRSIADADLARSSILFGWGSPLYVPPPTALGDYVPRPWPVAGQEVVRATIATDVARRAVAEVLVGHERADLIAPHITVGSAVFRAVVDVPTERLVVTGVHIDVWVAPGAFAGIGVAPRIAHYAGHRLTIASRFSPIALPASPDVGVPARTMPIDDWADTLTVRNRLVEAAAAVEVYRDSAGSLRRLTPAGVRVFDPTLRLVRGRGTSAARSVGIVVHPDRHGFTLRTTARNGWTYRLDSARHGHLVGTCVMAHRHSCGSWLHW